jgi:hypothetical protein
MKFLLIGRPGPTPTPVEHGAALYEAAKAFVNAKLADGSMDMHYNFADGSGGFAIANADSAEEALGDLVAYPLFPFLRWESHALADWSQAYDQFIEMFKRMGG